MLNLELIVLVVLLLGAAAVLLASIFSVLPAVSRSVTKSFWCPFHHCNVTAEFKEDVWKGAPFEVASCTAFAPPTMITCAKLCLRLEELTEQKAT